MTAMFVFWVNMTALAIVAVAWHRIVLLGETPRLWPWWRGQLYWQYFLRWFVLGIAIMLGLFAVFGLIYLPLVYVIADPVTLQLLDWVWAEPQRWTIFWTALAAGGVQFMMLVQPFISMGALTDPEKGYMSAFAEYRLAFLNVLSFSMGGYLARLS